MSEQNESNQEHNNMSPKMEEDEKTPKPSSDAITTETVEEDLNGCIFNSKVKCHSLTFLFP